MRPRTIHQKPGQPVALQQNPVSLIVSEAHVRESVEVTLIARFVVTASLLLAGNVSAQDYRVVFEGRPVAKVEANFEAVRRTELRADEKLEYAVRIVQRQGTYYWASRQMKRLIRHEAGAYITYIAVDGTGYVRIFIPLMLDMRDQLPDEQKNQEIGYTEHLLTQFASITYFGNRARLR